MKLNEIGIAELFVSFFNSKEFPKDIQDKLFEDINNNYWWMNGDINQFKFTGTKLIKDRIENLFPVVRGFDEWSFKSTDIIYDNVNNKIMIEVEVNGTGYGNQVYSNNYLFILSINENGKICHIREYLDANAVVQYSLNNNFISKQLNQ